jgi:hypothetical protein
LHGVVLERHARAVPAEVSRFPSFPMSCPFTLHSHSASSYSHVLSLFLILQCLLLLFKVSERHFGPHRSFPLIGHALLPVDDFAFYVGNWHWYWRGTPEDWQNIIWSVRVPVRREGDVECHGNAIDTRPSLNSLALGRSSTNRLYVT